MFVIAPFSRHFCLLFVACAAICRYNSTRIKCSRWMQEVAAQKLSDDQAQRRNKQIITQIRALTTDPVLSELRIAFTSTESNRLRKSNGFFRHGRTSRQNSSKKSVMLESRKNMTEHEKESRTPILFIVSVEIETRLPISVCACSKKQQNTPNEKQKNNIRFLWKVFSVWSVALFSKTECSLLFTLNYFNQSYAKRNGIAFESHQEKERNVCP